MLCPVDHTQLSADNSGAYPLHRCTRCSGISLKGNLLRDVRAYAALKLHRQQADAAVPGTRRCPSDGKAMKPLFYKGATMHACPQCYGLWLAADQLPRLLELAGPPARTDLPPTGQSLAPMPGNATSSRAEDWGDTLEFAVDVLDIIRKLAD
jgi:Zn-finger nucleic acid-binding protein